MELNTVKLTRLKKIIESLEKVFESSGVSKEDADVSFEYIIASCFPTCFENIQKELQHQYTLGYIEGKKEKK